MTLAAWAHRAASANHTASSFRTPSLSMSAPAPRATSSPRSITRYWSASERSVEDDVFLGKPLDDGAGFDIDAHLLGRPRPGASIPLGGSRRREERVGAGRRANVELERIAAGDASRRMHHDAVAAKVAFRVEGLLDDEGAIVPARCEDGSRVAALEAEREARLP